MTERIDHAAEALRVLEGAWDGRNVATDAPLVAQVHATLALVEQQRIANIIALGQPQDVPVRFGNGKATIAMTSWDHDGGLRDDIREGLGL